MELRDVSPRDGLQSEDVVLAPAVRASLAERLAAAGVPHVEVCSFVRAERVPQMGGAEEVAAALDPDRAWTASGLVLNERGYDRLAACGLSHASFAVPVTDEYTRRNQGQDVDASLAAAGQVARRARVDGRRFAVTLSVAFGCPFSGPVHPNRVVRLAERLTAAGVEEITIADTIGVAAPRQVRDLVGRVAALGVGVGVHLHNTRNTGYANALAAIEAGARWLDASVGGIGGCPFAPRATGNVATEDLAYLLRGEGVETGVDIGGLIEVSEWLESLLGHPLPGELYRAGDFHPVAAAA